MAEILRHYWNSPKHSEAKKGVVVVASLGWQGRCEHSTQVMLLYIRLFKITHRGSIMPVWFGSVSKNKGLVKKGLTWDVFVHSPYKKSLSQRNKRDQPKESIYAIFPLVSHPYWHVASIWYAFNYTHTLIRNKQGSNNSVNTSGVKWSTCFEFLYRKTSQTATVLLCHSIELTSTSRWISVVATLHPFSFLSFPSHLISPFIKSRCWGPLDG